jgi:nucleoside-diphosphate-sugar epimerase
MNSNIVLVTGANGFVGRSVISSLIGEKTIRGALHRNSINSFSSCQSVSYVNSELSANHDWTNALSGVSSIIHCSAKVHVPREKFIDDLTSFRAVNFEGTLQLARQAALASVKRFIFISSIGVLGDQTFDKPFSEEDSPQPHSPYTTSKFEAELGLRLIEQQFGMEVVIIRPPMVYGKNAPGNFGSLLHCIRRGIPLPFASITHNRRSFIYLENLVDFIRLCLDHPAAAGQTFLVADGHDLSTTEFIKKMASALEVSPRLIAIPPAVLNWCANIFGRAATARSLTASLQLDISKACLLLEWRPPVSVDDGLLRSVKWGM